jgi:hypothetical protein
MQSVLFNFKLIDATKNLRKEGLIGIFKTFHVFRQYLSLAMAGFEPSILGLWVECSTTVQPEAVFLVMCHPSMNKL